MSKNECCCPSSGGAIPSVLAGRRPGRPGLCHHYSQRELRHAPCELEGQRRDRVLTPHKVDVLAVEPANSTVVGVPAFRGCARCMQILDGSTAMIFVTSSG